MIKHQDLFSIEKCKEFLSKTLLSYGNISDASVNKITDAFEPVHFKKNHLILKSGEVAQYLYFICSGIVKISYKIDDREIIDWFAEEGIFVGNISSYQNNQPVTEEIETIEEVYLLRAPYADIIQFLKGAHEIETAARKIMEEYHAKYVQRTQNLKSLSAEKKYTLFMKEYAAYANRIPLKYIANYLGITPETLSRIRAR